MSSPIPGTVRAAILDALAALEAEERIAVLFAVESGSRAWGFPSPDSDWDVRFVYARPTRWHLTLRPGRDVLERPLADDIDLSGWDTRKALGLLLGGNCALREWLRSPILHRGNPEFLNAFRDLARLVPARRAARHHYLALARRIWHRHLEGRTEVNLKKYLYAVRPSLALRWLRENEEGEPPMDMPGLLAGVALPDAPRSALAGLLARKAVESELGHGARVPDLDALILEEMAVAAGPGPGFTREPAVEAVAEGLFRRSVAFADKMSDGMAA